MEQQYQKMQFYVKICLYVVLLLTAIFGILSLSPSIALLLKMAVGAIMAVLLLIIALLNHALGINLRQNCGISPTLTSIHLSDPHYPDGATPFTTLSWQEVADVLTKAYIPKKTIIRRLIINHTGIIPIIETTP